jgi:CBS domain containing-hemolysin-like protein
LELAFAAKLVGLAFFLVWGALTAAGEASLVHANRARLRSISEHGTERAEAVLRVLEQPGSSFGTLAEMYAISLAGAALCDVLAAVDLAPAGPIAPIALSLAALVLALVLQVLGRVVGVARPEATALRLYRPLSLLASLLTPVVLPLRALERRLLTVFGVTGPNDPHWAEEELKLLVESGEENGVLEQDEREMIHGIFELSEVTAREVMVPRIDVVAIPAEARIEAAVELIVATGHSRVPIYEGSIDNVVGIVYAKDILKHLRTGRLEDMVRPLARPAHFVPEAKKVDELLQELQQRRVHMAIVVDEYGGTAGIITIEDLLEEIVGEIRDEYDQAEETWVERIDAHEAIIDARTSIREVNEVMNLDLPAEASDTLGGLVYDLLGKVPVKGDEVRVDGSLIQVMSTDGRRIGKVRLVVGEAETP